MINKGSLARLGARGISARRRAPEDDRKHPSRWPSVRKAVAMGFAVSAAALLTFAGAASAGVSASWEAETMTRASGVTLTSSGTALRYGDLGAATKGGVAVTEDSDTVVARAAINRAADSRVCLRLVVDGTVRGADRCIGRGSTSYEDLSWTGLNMPKGSHTVAIRGVEITGNDAMFVDKVRVEGPPAAPTNSYPAPDTTGRTFSSNWTPAANTVHLNSKVKCGTDPDPDAGGDGLGVNVSNPNVVLVNPEISNCSRGIEVKNSGFSLLGDPGAAGYAGAASAGALHNNHAGVYFSMGSRDAALKGLGGDELFLKNMHRPVTIKAGSNLLFEDLDISHPASLTWVGGSMQVGGTIDNRSIIGIKALCDFSMLPASDRSCREIVIRSNDVRHVDEEGISLDANGNSDADSLAQGTSRLSAVNPAASTVTLAQPSSGTWQNLDRADGAYLGLNTGGAIGRYLKITGVNTATRVLTVSDPNGYLGKASAGDLASVAAPYQDAVIEGNVIDTQDGCDGIDFHGPVYRSTMRDNTITGTPSYRYKPFWRLRARDANGSYPQSIRVSSLADMPSGAMTPDVSTAGLASYNSVTGTNASWDVSFHRRGSLAVNNIPAYQSNNASANGVLYNDGSYSLLATDPNLGR